jgi:pilus assembly protein CpaB
MNPKQRRGVVFLILAGLGAAAIFFMVASYVASVQAAVGDYAPVLRLRTDISPYKPVTGDLVEEVKVPRRWLPATAVNTKAELRGLVASTALKRGSYLEQDMLTPPPALNPGQREIAILVDAETGVAGKIRSGGLVDIYATFEGSKGVPAASKIVVRQARIIDVGAVERITGEDKGQTSFEANQVVPVTFALTVPESLALTYAESFATKVRLALIGGGDNTNPNVPNVYTGGATVVQAPSRGIGGAGQSTPTPPNGNGYGGG